MPESLTSKPKLLPCPFCGGKAAYCEDVPDDMAPGEPHECHHIVCTGCGASADFGKDKPEEALDALRDACARHWNRRHPSEATGTPMERALQAVMARLANLLDEDQFNNIEAIVSAAGVQYPATFTKVEQPTDGEQPVEPLPAPPFPREPVRKAKRRRCRYEARG